MSVPPQFEAPSPEELHALLPAYDVLAFIAKGGMGAVYKAHQKSLERNVAIKILPREFGADQDFRKRFEDEAKAMARLNHPNLIGVYDFGEVDGMPYIVMEFVNGKSLHHSAHGKAIDQKEVARLVTGICAGLAHAHDAGILHRDIKPANILLDSEKRPKIGDFGLARQADASDGEGPTFGTPDYSAPEVLKDPRAVDKRSDVFATGVILYELLTGQLPEKNYVPASQIKNVDPRFDKIVRRATHPAPALRFADAGAMGKDITELKDALEKQVASIVTHATPLTVARGAQDTKEADDSSSTPAPPAPAAPQVQLSTGTNWALLRNLVIIVILLAAIFGMYRAYEWRKKDLERQRVEKEEREQDAKRQRIEDELAERRRQERIKAREALKPPTPAIPDKPKPKTPLEVLAELKPALAGGEREAFPPNTEVRGSSSFFFVETPLSWQRAASFAEAHGGHLATCVSEGEQNWLTSKIPADTTIWLGGGAIGRNAWGWVDGSEWNLRTPSTRAGNSITLSDLGTINAAPGGEKHPFFIQWRSDGTNPGTRAAQLTRLKDTLETPAPNYPPGIVFFENRRYLIIEDAMSWEDASEVAQSAHGHLAVPSEESEGEYLQNLVTQTLPEGEAAWIGGRNNGRSWSWITGEPWAFAAWAPDSPDGREQSDSAVRVVAGSKGGWDDANPGGSEAVAYVIEWSEDRSNTTIAGGSAGGGDWAGLRAQTIKKIRTLEGKYAEAILKNGKDLKWDLANWQRSLREVDERAYAPMVTRYRAKVKESGKINIAEDEKINLPPRAVTVISGYIAKQKKLDAALLQAADRIRNEYLSGLEEKKQAAQENGLSSQMRAIENEMKAVGEDGSTFLEHFGSTVGS